MAMVVILEDLVWDAADYYLGYPHARITATLGRRNCPRRNDPTYDGDPVHR
jgi:hypothetical protein